MTQKAHDEVTVIELEARERKRVRWILDEGFTGAYRLHSRYMLRKVPIVLLAQVNGEDAGTVLLDELTTGIGYVYYIAVARNHRTAGIGGKLLDMAMDRLRSEGMDEVYAVRDEENQAAEQLFGSRGFSEVDLHSFSERFGFWQAWGLRRRMTMVYGELLMGRKLGGKKGF